MSALVDLWSNEFSKLREKGRSMLPVGSSVNSAQPAEEQAARKSPEFSPENKPVAMRLHKSISEATLCMLLDVFSP